jgi:hypothetical protein
MDTSCDARLPAMMKRQDQSMQRGVKMAKRRSLFFKGITVLVPGRIIGGALAKLYRESTQPVSLGAWPQNWHHSQNMALQ